METNNKLFIEQGFKAGFSDYELQISIFLKHFKFLQNIGKFGGYNISGYSWIAYEHLIELYSIDTKITIGFFEEASEVQVYFEKKKNILFTERIWLQEILNEETAIKKIKNVYDMDHIYQEYAKIFKNNLMPLLKGKIWKKDI